MARLALFASGCLGLIGLLFAAVGPQQVTATPPRPTSVPTQAATAAPRRPAPTVVPTAVPPTPVPSIEPTPTLAPQPVVPTPDALDPPELRAVWVDAFHDGFKTPAQVDQLVAWARAANLNALFVQVRRRGDAYYAKSLEPRSEDLPAGASAPKTSADWFEREFQMVTPENVGHVAIKIGTG